MNSLKGCIDIILNENRNQSVFPLTNAACLKCKAVEENMWRVGALIFCDSCRETEFGNEDLNPIVYQRENYLKWLVKD